MSIENNLVHRKQILRFFGLDRRSFVKRDQKKFWNEKILTKIYQQNLDCRTELIEIGISEHGRFSSDSIENKVITNMKGGFYFTIGYDKPVK